MGLLGILVGLGVLIWLAFRGWSVLLLAPAAALIAALFGGEPLLANWTQVFMGSAARFLAQFFPLFLLGAIFKAQGWESSPFNLYPAKVKHMVRDIERIAQDRGLEFRLPEPFPQNSLIAARLALAGLEEGWGPAFVKGVYHAEFSEGRGIANAASPAIAMKASAA